MPQPCAHCPALHGGRCYGEGATSWPWSWQGMREGLCARRARHLVGSVRERGRVDGSGCWGRAGGGGPGDLCPDGGLRAECPPGHHLGVSSPMAICGSSPGLGCPTFARLDPRSYQRLRSPCALAWPNSGHPRHPANLAPGPAPEGHPRKGSAPGGRAFTGRRARRWAWGAQGGTTARRGRVGGPPCCGGPGLSAWVGGFVVGVVLDAWAGVCRAAWSPLATGLSGRSGLAVVS